MALFYKKIRQLKHVYIVLHSFYTMIPFVYHWNRSYCRVRQLLQLSSTSASTERIQSLSGCPKKNRARICSTSVASIMHGIVVPSTMISTRLSSRS
mmetsp:Transcript_10113/g.25346  ORF Transcript_10113/g.25346 Transcript_10113/m.25346 type:complete len:96 (+) Transcript_10113:21-308(+)